MQAMFTLSGGQKSRVALARVRGTETGHDYGKGCANETSNLKTIIMLGKPWHSTCQPTTTCSVIRAADLSAVSDSA